MVNLMVEKLFYKDPYQKEFDAKVLKIDGNQVWLDKTCFYPQGGGQIGDTGELNGEKVHLSFNDARTIKEIMSKGARNVFKNFSGNISLSIEREHDENGFKIGLFDIRSIFLESFKRRLEGLGMIIVSDKKQVDNELIISLNKFTLDLVDGNWISYIDYEARLIVNDE